MAETLLPGAYSQFVPSGGAPIQGTPDILPALIGKSLGKPVRIENEAVTRGGTANSVDALIKTGILRIVQISNTNGGPPNYQNGLDYNLGSGANVDKIDWAATTKLAPPTLDTPTKVSGAGGTFTGTGPWYYCVTARHGTTEETLPSGTVNISLGATTDNVILTWSRVPNATGYKVFRSSSSTFGVTSLIATVAGAGDTTTYTDTGSAAAAGQPPASNGTENEPLGAAVYYVTYEYADLTAAYGVVKRYTQISDVIADHGVGSEIAVMAEFAMSGLGTGNQARAVYCIGTNGTTQSYQTGVAALEAIRNEVLILVCGAMGEALNTTIRDHVQLMNTLEKKRERMAVLWAPSGAAIGNSSTVDTILYHANLSAIHPAAEFLCHVAVDSGSAYANVMQTTGLYASQVLVHQYLAAGLAGLVASLVDPAVPWTRKVFQGLTTMGGAEYTDTQLKTLRDAGVVVVDNEGSANWRILEGVTCKINGTQEQKIASIVIAKQVVLMTWRQYIDPPAVFVGGMGSLIGNKLTDGLLEQVITRTLLCLDYMLSRGIITSYDRNSITAVQDATDNTRVNVQFSYRPMYPSDRIVANVSFQAAA